MDMPLEFRCLTFHTMLLWAPAEYTLSPAYLAFSVAVLFRSAIHSAPRRRLVLMRLLGDLDRSDEFHHLPFSCSAASKMMEYELL